MQEDHDELEAVDVDVIGVPRIKCGPTQDARAPAAIEPKLEAVVDGASAL